MSELSGHAVAETPTVVARALLYIVRASPSLVLHPIIQDILPYLHQSRLVFPGKLIIKGRDKAIHEANCNNVVTRTIVTGRLVTEPRSRDHTFRVPRSRDHTFRVIEV